MQYQHGTLETLDNDRANRISATLLDKVQQYYIRQNTSREKQQYAIDTTILLQEQEFSAPTLLAALLEPALDENTAQNFDIESTKLSHNVRTLNSILSKNNATIEPATLTKIILAHSEDLRTILITIAQTLVRLRFPTKTAEDQTHATIARQILVPLCHKLGVGKMKWELEDLAMKKLEPAAYAAIKRQLNEKRTNRSERLEELEEKIRSILQRHNIRALITGRIKNIYRIYQKMLQQNRKFSEIQDLIGTRIICNSTEECYRILGMIQQEFVELKNSFTDYIQNPKPNGYQSVHLNIDWKGQPAEIQIRSWTMHQQAEDGLAAHWEYKQFARDPLFDSRLSFAKQFSDWISHEKNRHIMQTLRIQFEQNRVFVLTPKNEVIELPDGATPVDFAFIVHTQLGTKCEKAKVNGKIVPLDYVLENGDVVEIITSEKQKPKRSWLSFVKTEKARNRIRAILNIEPNEVKKPIRRKYFYTPKKGVRPHLAKCCGPLPGDEITGIKTTKRKIIIHRTTCPNVQKEPEHKRVQIRNEEFPQQPYQTTIQIVAQNRVGILAEILNRFTQAQCHVISTKTITRATQFSCQFQLQIQSARNLDRLLENIRKIKGVTEASRT